MTKAAAETALMTRLEEWAADLGDHIKKADGKSRYYPTRSIPAMRKAYDKGRLFEHLTEWLPSYRGLGHSTDQSAADRMAEFVAKGLPCWEDIVAAPNEPWSPWISPADRAILNKVVADVHARANRLLRARLAAQALLQQGRHTP